MIIIGLIVIVGGAVGWWYVSTPSEADPLGISAKLQWLKDHPAYIPDVNDAGNFSTTSTISESLASCTADGVTLQNGESTTFYENSTVVAPATCSKSNLTHPARNT